MSRWTSPTRPSSIVLPAAEASPLAEEPLGRQHVAYREAVAGAR